MDSGTGTGGAESVLKVLATLAGALNTRQSASTTPPPDTSNTVSESSSSTSYFQSQVTASSMGR